MQKLGLRQHAHLRPHGEEQVHQQEGVACADDGPIGVAPDRLTLQLRREWLHATVPSAAADLPLSCGWLVTCCRAVPASVGEQNCSWVASSSKRQVVGRADTVETPAALQAVAIEQAPTQPAGCEPQL